MSSNIQLPDPRREQASRLTTEAIAALARGGAIHTGDPRRAEGGLARLQRIAAYKAFAKQVTA
jgi:hypothetical protein